MGVGRAALSTLAVVCAVLTLAACGGPDDDPAAQADPMFAEAIENARASGASAGQLDVLERAARHNAVTLAMLREALEQTYDCLGDANIRVDETVDTTPWGTTDVWYTMSVPSSRDAETAETVGDACVQQHSLYVEGLYAQQPSTTEAKDRHRATVVQPGIEQCLDEFGIAFDDGDFPSVWDQAFVAMQERGDQVVDGVSLRECFDPYFDQAG